MVVQHNMQAANANRMLGITSGAQAKSTEKLSSGYKINRAADDAAGLTISEKMRKQIRGLDKASSNAQDGVSSVQTAEGALTEVHSMLQRMNELAVQSANGTNSSDDRQAIQDEVDQLTTEIDRVAETTKFNEIYLLKGDNSNTKNVYMKGHDAGLKGSLTDGAKSATFTMDALKTGDKVTIAGKEYSIGSTVADAKKTYAAAADGEKVTIDGTEYTVVGAAGTEDAGANKLKVTSLDAKVKDGSTVSYKTTTVKAMTDADNNGIDDDDSSIISKDVAESKIKAELLTANNIGTVNQAATVEDAKTANGKTSYTINKGYATVADTLSFNLHVGADADMTNKITVDIDTMNSANLGIKGINVKDASGTEATYAIDAIADAVAKVSSQRSALGAVQNRLEHTIDNLDNISENTSSAESRIRDTDMAKEMVNYSKNNILAQAGQSMLAQANQSNQGVLSLLQ
ncbi:MULTISPECIES: flagellin [Roseburia]|uniref:flagellin N-terminal helical domain-containing protein n=1 Tax=Roseburia TaxID=841 RepID=UPI0011063EC8|nr:MULTISPECIES: flagellin [Roseburia]